MRQAVIFRDKQGQQRNIIQTDSHHLICFQYRGEPMRLITILDLPYSKKAQEYLLRSVAKELEEIGQDKRFNRLGPERELVAAYRSNVPDSLDS